MTSSRGPRCCVEPSNGWLSELPLPLGRPLLEERTHPFLAIGRPDALGDGEEGMSAFLEKRAAEWER